MESKELKIYLTILKSFIISSICLFIMLILTPPIFAVNEEFVATYPVSSPDAIPTTPAVDQIKGDENTVTATLISDGTLIVLDSMGNDLDGFPVNLVLKIIEIVPKLYNLQ